LHSSALIKLLQDPAPFRAILLGAYAGLAAGAKYIGALFLPFALAAILLISGPCSKRRLRGAAAFVYELFQRRDRRRRRRRDGDCGGHSALCTSVRINGTPQDPRAVVPPILAATGARIATDRYAHYDASRTFLGEPQLRPNADIADIVVTANLAYDRFKNYAARKDMVSKPVAGYYHHPNALPHLDGSNGRPTFGYFNPDAQGGRHGRVRGAA